MTPEDAFFTAVAALVLGLANFIILFHKGRI